ncbi:MAG: type II toxin-antitoxin system VapC family toxin [Anaerolineae bacterium]
MNLVIDTSVLIAVILTEPTKESLVAQTVGTTLLAPLSVHWEIGNALSAMLKRKRINVSQARLALAAYEQIPIRFVDVGLEQAVALSAQLDIYAYDAYILAAALNQNCPVLSLDHGLLYAARRVGVTVVEVNR